MHTIYIIYIYVLGIHNERSTNSIPFYLNTQQNSSYKITNELWELIGQSIEN